MSAAPAVVSARAVTPQTCLRGWRGAPRGSAGFSPSCPPCRGPPSCPARAQRLGVGRSRSDAWPLTPGSCCPQRGFLGNRLPQASDLSSRVGSVGSGSRAGPAWPAPVPLGNRSGFTHLQNVLFMSEGHSSEPGVPFGGTPAPLLTLNLSQTHRRFLRVHHLLRTPSPRRSSREAWDGASRTGRGTVCPQDSAQAQAHLGPTVAGWGECCRGQGRRTP